MVPVLVRTGALLALFALFQLIAWLSAFATPGDANIGLGLLTFAATALLSGIWGFNDGRRNRLWPVLVRWLVVALLTTAGTLVMLAALGDSPEPFAVRIANFLDIAPLIAGLVLIPAIGGAAVGFAVGAGSRPADARGAGDQPPSSDDRRA